MQPLPTHRHKKTGDIVFWGDHLDPKQHEKLPAGFWDSEEQREARLAGAVAGLKADAERDILAKWPIYKQLNAIHEPDAPWIPQMRAEIKSIRDRSNVKEQRLRAEKK